MNNTAENPKAHLRKSAGESGVLLTLILGMVLVFVVQALSTFVVFVAIVDQLWTSKHQKRHTTSPSVENRSINECRVCGAHDFRSVPYIPGLRSVDLTDDND